MAGGRGSLSAKTITLFALLLLLSRISCFSINNSLETTIEAKNPASLQVDLGIGIGIGIGGGGSPPPESGSGGCPPPPPPPPCPPPTTPPPAPTPKKSPPKTKTKPKTKPPPKPPSPPMYPMPSDFENIYLYHAYFVIQRFRKSLTCDHKNVSQTWYGFDLCSKYKGFYCATPPGFKNSRRIASVDFNQFKLCAPTISGFVDQLPDLALFHANSNKFSGTVPDLTRLPYLYEVDVSNNLLAGPFPTNVLPLSNLTFLDLRFNRFAGSVPPPVFLIPLDVLFLNNDLFAGPIPSDLFATTALYLTLANNFFTGSIPSSIGNASNHLREVLFLNNSLSGCLPYQIGLLNKATVFDAGFNAITGPIPLSFGCLRKVEQLNLAGNLLYGEIPDAVCRLGFTCNLANLSLSSNYFTSLGPSCVKLLEKGVLDIRKNCIPGCSNQRPPAECARFLKQPKVACPMTTYMPCKLSAVLEGTALPAAGERRRPQPYYSAYSALHERRERHQRRDP